MPLIRDHVPSLSPHLVAEEREKPTDADVAFFGCGAGVALASALGCSDFLAPLAVHVKYGPGMSTAVLPLSSVLRFMRRLYGRLRLGSLLNPLAPASSEWNLMPADVTRLSVLGAPRDSVVIPIAAAHTTAS